MSTNKIKNKFCSLPFALCLLILTTTASATIRYVSHTGSSTPPYTTWETAADSIQKCINYSVDGDTIIVANGVYYESLIVDKYLWLIGSSMDSTVIDGTGLNTRTIDAKSDFNLTEFTIIGMERANSRYIISCINFNVTIINCRLYQAGTSIYLARSSGRIENVIISNCDIGLQTFCFPDTCHPEITNSVIIMENTTSSAISIFDGGSPTITNNIILGKNSQFGVNILFNAKTIVVKNNIVAGFSRSNIYSTGTNDSSVVENNIATYQITSYPGSIHGDSRSNIKNNIIAHNRMGIIGELGVPNTNNNLYWENIINTGGEAALDSTDILRNPMFINDTIPVYGGTYDYHLQAYSPAIDAGDPNIFDVDGTRSDIGVYGGPLGESYKYQDLAPRPPVNLSGQYDSLNIEIKWNKNTEADLNSYKIYRDTLPDFPADSTTFVLSLTDTSYAHLIPPGKTKFYYKVSAADNQGNESQPSEELFILIVSADEYPVIVNDYRLYQNYPNPFNPVTKIGYNIKERSYVKLMVYDIKGERIAVLVNEEKEAGYYEVEFLTSGIRYPESGIQSLASGIYLYRIEVIGKGNIPVYSDMKKMVLIK